ncbi:MAG: T9SS type A sorting domain-containing protein [Patescibacteria group bacterium]|jgi:hypothetical protein
MNPKKLLVALCIVMLVGLIVPHRADATTYVVYPDGSGPTPNIQAAINAAIGGDIIELTDGIFTGDGNRDIDFVGKAITVRSQSGNPESCVIDCQGSSETPHIGFYFDSSEGAGSKLIGVKIINGFDYMYYAPLAIYVSGASPTIDGCVFVDNGVSITGYVTMLFLRSEFRDFNSGGGMTQPPIDISNTGGRVATVTVEDCAFRNCTFGGEYGYGTAIDVGGTGSLGSGTTNTVYVRRSFFENLNGTAVSLGGTGDVTVWGYLEDNVIQACGNSMMSTPAINVSTNSSSDTHALMSGNLIYNCPVAAISIYGYSPQIWVESTNNTIADCATGINKGSAVVSLVIDKTILWNADDLNGVLSSEITCCDISDGDFAGIGGNFSEDPLFCDPSTGQYTISTESPCVDGYGCGRIGALGIACGYVITSVIDIPRDQGKQVRISWGRSSYDPETVVSYTILRRVDSFDKLYPPGDWDVLQTVPAWGEDAYNAVCPTLCDSSLSGGMCYSTFFIRANTGSPSVHYDCAPDSGYSVDNLAPAPPAGFALNYNGGNVLTWLESPEADFDYFSLYGSTLPDFVPGPENLIVQQSNTGYVDNAPANMYYRITATDFNGNTSDDAFVTPNPSSVPTDNAPLAFSLSADNPTTGRIGARFSLPTAGDVKLVLYSVAGARVADLINGPQTAGSHAVTYNEPVASGAYYLRLVAGDQHITKKVVVLQ